MSNYELGNINRDKDYSLYQIGRSKKALTDAQAAKVKEEQVQNTYVEQRKTEANSLDALGNYGMAFSGMNKKTDVSALGLTAHDQVAVGKYVTPEQQARIADDMMKYFG